MEIGILALLIGGGIICPIYTIWLTYFCFLRETTGRQVAIACWILAGPLIIVAVIAGFMIIACLAARVLGSS